MWRQVLFVVEATYKLWQHISCGSILVMAANVRRRGGRRCELPVGVRLRQRWLDLRGAGIVDVRPPPGAPV